MCIQGIVSQNIQQNVLIKEISSNKVNLPENEGGSASLRLAVFGKSIKTLLCGYLEVRWTRLLALVELPRLPIRGIVMHPGESGGLAELVNVQKEHRGYWAFSKEAEYTN